MALRIENLTFIESTIGTGESSVMANFTAGIGLIANKDVTFTLSVEDDLPIHIVDANGEQVKSYEWTQEIEQSLTDYEMPLVFIVTGRRNRKVPCQVVLEGTDSEQFFAEIFGKLNLI